MRFVRRLLLNTLTVLSLLLCVAAAVLWSRSYWRAESISVYGPWPRAHQWRYSLDILTCQGALMLETSGLEHLNMVKRPAGPDDDDYDYHFGERWSRPWQPGDENLLKSRFGREPEPIRFLGVMVGGHEGTESWPYSLPAPAPDEPQMHFIWRRAVVPYPLLVTAFVLLPALRLWRWWRRRRQKPPGHCPGCGYDLRASPGRCPECGTISAAEGTSIELATS
jgi:hypothetical protein